MSIHTPSDRVGAVSGVDRALLSDLLSHFDVLELLDRVVHAALAASGTDRAALLVPHVDGLQVLAATSERARDLELFQVMTGEGPAFDSLREARRVQTPDLASMHELWPRFAPVAEALGVRSITSLHMQLRDTTVGALCLFGRSVPDTRGLEDAQTLADIAVLALLQPTDRNAENVEVKRRLRQILDRRVEVEYAKGVLAEWLQITPAEAGAVLMDRARETGELLGALAGRIVRLEADPAEFTTSEEA
jgi:predicted nucleotidyltransferase